MIKEGVPDSFRASLEGYSEATAACSLLIPFSERAEVAALLRRAIFWSSASQPEGHLLVAVAGAGHSVVMPSGEHGVLPPREVPTLSEH